MKKILNQELKHFIHFFKQLTLRDQLTNEEVQLLLKLFKLYADDGFYVDDLQQRLHKIQPDELSQQISTLLQLSYLTRTRNGCFTLSKKAICHFQKLKLI